MAARPCNGIQPRSPTSSTRPNVSWTTNALSGRISSATPLAATWPSSWPDAAGPPPCARYRRRVSGRSETVRTRGRPTKSAGSPRWLAFLVPSPPWSAGLRSCVGSPSEVLTPRATQIDYPRPGPSRLLGTSSRAPSPSTKFTTKSRSPVWTPCHARSPSHGRRSIHCFRSRHTERLRARLPRATLKILADVGHAPMIDDPELVARTILEVTGARMPQH